MLEFLKRLGAKNRNKQPFASAWLSILSQRVGFYALLTAAEQSRLRDLIAAFLDDVTFEGCGGLEMTDEIRVTIAAHACLLLLNREQASYPGLRSVLVYPSSYVAPSEYVDAIGVVHEGDERRLGEAWMRGAVILSWDDVQHDSRDFAGGRNVTLHEFAHQLDQEDGTFDGAPVLENRARYRSWARILMKEYQTLQRAADADEPSVIDQYGATDPAEFFAVVTEAFFEKPRALRQKHPQLYAELRKFFRQDPAERFAAAGRDATR
ncbi:MAG TPA: M90 family metallopeptidase [Chthoniobacterales bacterium]